MKGLTKRQKEIVDFIDTFIQRNRFSPSYRDIMTHFGFSSLGSVHCHLKILKRKGVVTQEGHCSRSIALTTPQREQPDEGGIACTLIGYLAANRPIELLPQIQTVSLPAALVPNPDTSYVLRTRGDSLVSEHITDGDLVVIETAHEPQAGDTVLATLAGNQTIIGRYYPEGPHIRLESCSPSVPPTVVPTNSVAIQGILTAILRLYS